MASCKIDMHVHSVYSQDSLILPQDIIKWASYKKLDGVVICDHNSLKAYHVIKRSLKNNAFILIPGMEILTHIGEVIALFIEDEIKAKDNNFFTFVEKIKDQNGLVLIPHPFDFLRNNHLKMNLLTDNIIQKYIHGIEILNSRIIVKSCVKKAQKFNLKYKLFETGGSDAHTKREIGKAFTLIEDVTDKSLDSIRESLLAKKSKSLGKLSNPLVHLITVMNKLKKGAYF